MSISIWRKVIFKRRKAEFRDPRFDDSAGNFNQRKFLKSYEFLRDMKKAEVEGRNPGRDNFWDKEKEVRKLKKKRNKPQEETIAKKQELGNLKQDFNNFEDQYKTILIKDKIKQELKSKGISPRFISRR